jgi:hypothetical protein
MGRLWLNTGARRWPGQQLVDLGAEPPAQEDLYFSPGVRIFRAGPTGDPTSQAAEIGPL